MNSKATCIGIVGNVDGTTVSVQISNHCVPGLVYVNGEGYKVGQVGCFVKIPIGFNNLFGIVTKVGADAAPKGKSEEFPHGNMWMTVQLLGEGTQGGMFERGISQYPIVNDEVHLVLNSDLNLIYGESTESFFVKIGHIAGSESIPALLDINKLVVHHSAIVGTTGSGKSTTVASLLMALSDSQRYSSARIIVLDIHGEYASALKDKANVYRINADSKNGENELYLPYWALNFDELLEVSFGTINGDREKVVLNERILKAKKESYILNNKKGLTLETVNADTPIPFSLHKLWYDMYKENLGTYYNESGKRPMDNLAYEKTEDGSEMCGDPLKGIAPTFKKVETSQGSVKINYVPNSMNIGGNLVSLGAKLRIPRYDFLFNPGPWAVDIDGNHEKDLDELFKGWIGGNRPITIFDVSGVPNQILNTIIGVLLRILYDALFWTRNLSQGGRERPLLIVMEEAHNYLNDSFSGLASNMVQRIVKEGRKYGIGAMIVSQRPSEINSTVLSQCGTTIALRLANASDRGHICATASDNIESLTNMLPVLRTGEAIVLGEGVKLPMRVFITPPPADKRPNSNDPIIIDSESTERSKYPGGWGNKTENEPNYEEFIETWRSQDPKYVKKKRKEDKMQRQTVSSSNVASIGYDVQTQTLEVEFNHGGVYQYYDVPQQVYEAFISAESKGKYLANNIKGHYRYFKV